jgi:hypothetical protein
MFWVRVLIWVSLAALGATVVVLTFRGGPIPEDRRGAYGGTATSVPHAAPDAAGSGEMAYDRWRPGHRTDPERLREPSP